MIKSINYVILQIQVAIEKSWNCQTPDIRIFTIDDDDDDYKIKQTNKQTSINLWNSLLFGFDVLYLYDRLQNKKDLIINAFSIIWEIEMKKSFSIIIIIIRNSNFGKVIANNKK